MSNNNLVEKYCYDNEPDSCTKYGGLYLWDEMMQYSTQQGLQGICPTGWHLPTDDDWQVLVGAVDSQYGIGEHPWENYDAGTNLKTTSGWHGNGNGTYLFGFSGLPGGERVSGNFYLVGRFSIWWTSTEYSFNSWYAWFRYLQDVCPTVHSGSMMMGEKHNGNSIRCLRDY